MSCFLEIFRCLLCCEEDAPVERRYRDYGPLLTVSSDNERNYVKFRNEPLPKKPEIPQRSSVDLNRATSGSNPSVPPKKSPESSNASKKPEVPQRSLVNPNLPTFVSYSTRSPVDLNRATFCSDSWVPPKKLPESPNASKKPEVPQRSSVDPNRATSGSNPSVPLKKSPESPNLSLIVKGSLPVYDIPENLKDLYKRDKLPEVLRKPLTPVTYADYFAALLYAEDFYEEKWNGFLLSEVTLELREEPTYEKSSKKKHTQRDKKVYVAFEIDSIPERRPYLLSRDYVFVRPSGTKVEPFKGFLSRVVRSTLVLAEFGDDFLLQYSSKRKYDVSFSFNRVCLKRSHQAVAAALDPSFQIILFPTPLPRTVSFTPCSVVASYRNLEEDQTSAVYKILSLNSPPPYLIVGLLSTSRSQQLTRTGVVVREAVLQIYRKFPNSRVLVTAATNNACDVLMRSLKRGIPDSELFRGNAAFRGFGDVPDDILPSCSYEGECFTFPSLHDLRKFKVVTSTFVSSFRLHSVGIIKGHFTHIFMVDASSATEPEVMIALTNLVDEKTAVVVTGSLGDCPIRVRSDVARRNGLKRSFLQRLLENKPYSSCDPMFVTHLRSADAKPDDTASFISR